jgi:hypothetical protein
MKGLVGEESEILWACAKNRSRKVSQKCVPDERNPLGISQKHFSAKTLNCEDEDKRTLGTTKFLDYGKRKMPTQNVYFF